MRWNRFLVVFLVIAVVFIVLWAFKGPVRMDPGDGSGQDEPSLNCETYIYEGCQKLNDTKTQSSGECEYDDVTNGTFCPVNIGPSLDAGGFVGTCSGGRCVKKACNYSVQCYPYKYCGWDSSSTVSWSYPTLNVPATPNISLGIIYQQYCSQGFCSGFLQSICPSMCDQNKTSAWCS